MGNERRRHPRVQAEIPFRLVGEGGKEEPFDLVDLSEAGARITCDRPITAMTRIRVAMVLPGPPLGRGEAPVTVDTTGVVVWSHRVEGGRYDTGVFFSELEDGQREILQTFVDAKR
jgi:hypothetical protein